MNSRVRPTMPDDIRCMIAEDQFCDLIDGQLMALPHSQKLLRALALAAACGHFELVRELVREGADLSRGTAALVEAAESGHAEIVRFLVEAGVPVDARCEMFGASALMHAAGCGVGESVAMLLFLGADPHATDSNGHTARSWAEMGFQTIHSEPIPILSVVDEGFRQVFAALPET